MDEKILDSLKHSDIQTKAILISIVIGFIFMVVLLLQIHGESYSQVYLYPDSIRNEKGKDTTYFIYGIKSFENSAMTYNVTFYLDNNFIDQKTVELKPTESFEESKSISLPQTGIPMKIRLLARTNHENYEVFYWLK